MLFKQKRIAKEGFEFQMHNFWSMCVDAESYLDELRLFNGKTDPVFKINNDPRVKRVGQWPCKVSLNELPRFVNVLKKDLAVAGPRPVIPTEVVTYIPRERQSLKINTGITCYWHTRWDRDSVAFGEWIGLDLRRTKQCSLWVI